MTAEMAKEKATPISDAIARTRLIRVRKAMGRSHKAKVAANGWKPRLLWLRPGLGTRPHGGESEKFVVLTGVDEPAISARRRYCRRPRSRHGRWSSGPSPRPRRPDPRPRQAPRRQAGCRPYSRPPKGRAPPPAP